MFYLIVAILCSSSIAIIFRFSETRKMNRLGVTSFNYLGAVIVSALLLVLNPPALVGRGENFFKELPSVLTNTHQVFEGINSVYWAVLVGIPAGLFFFLAFVFYQKSIHRGSISLAGAFSKLGILVPMTMAIILWREFPTTVQWTGVFLALIAIIIIYKPFGVSLNKEKLLPLALLFVFGGVAEFSNKIFQHYSVSGYRSVFLFSVFSSAFVISSSVLIISRKRFGQREVLTGLILGIPNLFSSFFLIMALESMKSSVAFPLYSAGSVALIAIWGVLFFSEKLERSEVLAVTLILFSLVLVNL